MPTILLDTHTAIWSAEQQLSARTMRLIDSAAERGDLLLSPISAWEIGMLSCRGRLKLSRPVDDYVRDLFSRPGVLIAPLSIAIALDAALLPRALSGDPADRILVATAAAYDAQLVTRDKAIQDYAKNTKTIRCIAC